MAGSRGVREAALGFKIPSRERGVQLLRRPKVYFEEWDDPMISGIGWVSELIDAAGGIDIFADRASCKSAKDRIVTTEEVIRREPDIGSWCGKKFRPEKVANREGFDRLAAVQFGELHEIKSSLNSTAGPGRPDRWTCGAASNHHGFGNCPPTIPDGTRVSQKSA